MKGLDERGRIGGKLNLIDLIIIIIVVIAVVVAVRMVRTETNAGGGTVDMTFTVLVEGIQEETYEAAAEHIPSQLIASGSYVDAYVTDSKMLPHTVYVIDEDWNKVASVDSDLVDALFTVEATVPREAVQLNTLGTQEIRIGKIHYLKTTYFEFTGTIYTAEWDGLPLTSELPAD